MTLLEPYLPDAHGLPLKDILIRPAVPGDASALARIDAERHDWGPEHIEAKIHSELQRIQDGTLRKKAWVACVDETVVAYAKCAHRQHVGPPEITDLPDGWYLGGLGVQNTMRRRGLGRSLTACRLEWIRSQKADAWYFTAAANKTSIALHEHFGFKEELRGIELPDVSFAGEIGILFGLRWGPGS